MVESIGVGISAQFVIVHAQEANVTTVQQSSSDLLNKDILNELNSKLGKVKPDTQQTITLSNGVQAVIKTSLGEEGNKLKSSIKLKSDSFSYTTTLTYQADFVFHGSSIGHFKATPQVILTRYNTDVTVKEWTNDRFYIGIFNGTYDNKSTTIIQAYATQGGSAKIKRMAKIENNGFKIPYTGDISMTFNIYTDGSMTGSFQSSN